MEGWVLKTEEIRSITQEFLDYLGNPTSPSDWDRPLEVLYHPTFKQLKHAFAKNHALVPKVMEYIAKKISVLDFYKVGLSCFLFQEFCDYKNPSPFMMQFTLGMLIRTLLLSERYLAKSLKYIENKDLSADGQKELQAWKSLDYVISPATLALSFSPLTRDKLRENPNHLALIDNLRTFVSPLDEILRLSRLCDRTSYYILHPKRGLGFRLLASGIQNNAHLFTLFQDALLQFYPEVFSVKPNLESNAMAIAKGHRKFDIDRVIPIPGLFLYYSKSTSKGDTSLPFHFTANFLLDEKDTPANLENWNGQKIIFLEDITNETVYWDTHAFRPINIHLTSSVESIERIPTDALKKILLDLKDSFF
jgi:hypothetical protein